MTGTTGAGQAQGEVLVAGVFGVVVLLVVTGSALLLLDNLYGPFGESESGGFFAALGCGALAGAVGFLVARWVASHSRIGLLAVVAGAVAFGWVFVPRQIDVTESFVPRVNERYSCTGWTFWHYPPGTMDGSATTYCIGFERRIADG
ncbi:MAG: hypothetical protein ACXWDI_00995 [Nocardioides sp.]